MSGNTDMPKEVMEWTLEHIEYYCPMDEDTEAIMVDFISNMYLEEWEKASDKCIRIFRMIGDNFVEHIYGITNGKKIFSKYLDAYTLENPEDGMRYPIGYLKEKKVGGAFDGEVKKIHEKVISLDKGINFDRNIQLERVWITVGLCLVILGFLLLDILASFRHGKLEVLFTPVLFIFLGYFISRIKYTKKHFWEKISCYYQGMVVDKFDAMVSWDELKQKEVSVNCIFTKNFLDQVNGTKKSGDSSLI